jgi:hypothetical protein
LVQIAKGPIRTQLRMTQAWSISHFAWLCLEIGDLRCASYWSGHGLALGIELNEPHIRMRSLGIQAGIAVDTKHYQRAIDLSAAMMRDQGAVTSPMRGLGYRMQADAYAAAKDRNHCERALDLGMVEALDTSSDDPYDIRRYFDPSFMEVEALGCWVRLGLPAKTIEIYESRSNHWPEQYKRQSGLSLSRLAKAYAAVDNPEMACILGNEAIEIATATRSGTTIRELLRLQEQLKSWKTTGVTDEFDDGIRNLVSFAGRPQARDY